MLNLGIIGQRIATHRRAHDMNQNDLAEALFVTRQAVSKWEIGKGLPSIEILLALTKLFNISIDSLLEASDINQYDYKDMLATYPRESVVYKFLESDTPDLHVKDIFYLLTPTERMQMINQSLSNRINLSIKTIWPYASISERKYILGNILSKGSVERVEEFYPMLTDEERVMVSKTHHMHTVVYHHK